METFLVIIQAIGGIIGLALFAIGFLWAFKDMYEHENSFVIETRKLTCAITELGNTAEKLSGVIEEYTETLRQIHNKK